MDTMNVWFRLLEKMDLTPEEKDFLKEVEGGPNGELKVLEKGRIQISNVVSTLYLAKQIEAARKSTDKSSKAMVNLTWMIAIFTAVQAFGTILPEILQFLKWLFGR